MMAQASKNRGLDRATLRCHEQRTPGLDLGHLAGGGRTPGRRRRRDRAARAGCRAALRCTPQTASRLYFGFDTPEGPLSETRRQAFVESEVAPRLPAGFTVWTARGQWRSSDGATRQEDSRVLEVVGADDAAQRHRLAEIVGRYEARFRQESVLVMQASARACW
jgi:hypothetical protein